jgi:hypothetical protein
MLEAAVQGLDLSFEGGDFIAQNPSAIGDGIRFFGEPRHGKGY